MICVAWNNDRWQRDNLPSKNSCVVSASMWDNRILIRSNIEIENLAMRQLMVMERHVKAVRTVASTVSPEK